MRIKTPERDDESVCPAGVARARAKMLRPCADARARERDEGTQPCHRGGDMALRPTCDRAEKMLMVTRCHPFEGEVR